MKIIVDAMGGDNAPMAPVEAAVRAVKELDVEIVLVGKKEVVEKELSAYDYPNDKISIAKCGYFVQCFAIVKGSNRP